MAGLPRTALLVHGLLGSKRNWRTFAKGLAAELAEETQHPWRFYLLDLRNHGASHRKPGFEGPHTLETAAHDLVRFASEVVRPETGKDPDAVIGHSLGGKIVLEYVHQTAESGGEVEAPKQAWVLDSVPGLVLSDNSGVPEVIESVKSIPTPIPSKEWLDVYLKAQGYSPGLRQWLATSLIPHSEVKGALDWQFDIQGAASMYASYRSADFWRLLHKPPPRTEIHIVRALQSDRWTPETLTSMDEAVTASRADPSAGKFHYLELEDAGHWLHADNPKGLHDMMLRRLSVL
uniref:AB hydrolase-1 domain-containing protein n=1 Tax=Tetraselmis chuii TaxID=63592 RepID=A0A7S1T8G2_9CHLO